VEAVVEPAAAVTEVEVELVSPELAAAIVEDEKAAAAAAKVDAETDVTIAAVNADGGDACKRLTMAQLCDATVAVADRVAYGVKEGAAAAAATVTSAHSDIDGTGRHRWLWEVTTPQR
jgi:hypothetical protein